MAQTPNPNEGARPTVSGYPAYGYAPVHAPSSGLDVKDIFRILYRRKGFILGLVLIVTALAGLVSYQLTPQYTAQALLMIEPRESRIIDMQAVLDRLPGDGGTTLTQIRLMHTRPHAERVVDRLGLASDPRFDPDFEEETALEALAGRAVDWLRGYVPNEWLIASGLADQANDGAEREPVPYAYRRARAVSMVLSGLDVQQDGASRIIQVNFTSPDPELAARVANATAEVYIEQLLEEKLAATRHASGWLGERVDELREQLRESERALERFRAENDLIEARGVVLTDAQFGDLNSQLLQARAEASQIAARLSLARGIMQRGEGYEAISEILESGVVQGFRRDEAALTREEAQLALELGDRHPRIIQLRAEIANVREKIAYEMRNIVRNLENQLAVVRTRERSLEQSLGRAQQASAETRQVEVQLRELVREVEANRTLYQAYLQRVGETREQEEILSPEARVVSDARVPGSPSFPRPRLFMAAGFTASLLFGTLLAFLIERLDSGLRSSRQIEEKLGLPVLGLVPRVRGLKRDQRLHRYLLEKPLSAYAEAVRGVFTALQLLNTDDPPKVVVVTSTVPGEGKTTLAASLAASTTRAGFRTILVDLDLRHPSTHREFQQQVRLGVVEYLAGDCELDEAIIADGVQENLHFLPVRRLTASPTELIGSERMRLLLEELRRRYDYVVIDTTPALGITDAKIAARLADKVLFVVRWEKTTDEMAQNGLQALLDAQADVAGAVLSQVDIKRHAKYGYGDVGHYYGSYKKYYVN